MRTTSKVTRKSKKAMSLYASRQSSLDRCSASGEVDEHDSLCGSWIMQIGRTGLRRHRPQVVAEPPRNPCVHPKARAGVSTRLSL